MLEFVMVLALWLVCAVVGASVTRSKGRGSVPGALLGLFLGPVGLLIAVILPRNEGGLEAEAIETGDRRRCPQCAELVRREARKCRFCGAELDPLPVAQAEPAPAPSPRRLVAATLVMAATILLVSYVFNGARPAADPYGIEAQP